MYKEVVGWKRGEIKGVAGGVVASFLWDLVWIVLVGKEVAVTGGTTIEQRAAMVAIVGTVLSGVVKAALGVVMVKQYQGLGG